MNTTEQRKRVTNFNIDDHSDWEEDGENRQDDGSYSHDDALEQRRALDDCVDRVVKELEERRFEDPQIKKDQLELAKRREDDTQIYKELGELKMRRKVEREANEAEATAMREIKLAKIPTRVSFEPKKRSRSPSKSRRSKLARMISEAVNLQHCRGNLIDLTDSLQHLTD